MSWLGKILGGGLGFVIGGPIGAIFGAVAGHAAFDSGAGLSLIEQRQSVFFVASFSMLAKLAKADGVVSQSEIDAIERVMVNNLRLDARSRLFAIDIFNQAKDSPDSFRAYAEQFYEEFKGSPEVLGSLIDLLLLVAYADGSLHKNEEALIAQAVSLFQLDANYEQLKARFTGGNLQQGEIERSYELLGANAEESLLQIKKKYRKLAMEYHPDRLVARGVSPEFAAGAEERFKEIQHAYDVLEKHLG